MSDLGLANLHKFLTHFSEFWIWNHWYSISLLLNCAFCFARVSFSIFGKSHNVTFSPTRCNKSIFKIWSKTWFVFPPIAGKPLLMLQSLKRAMKVNADDARVSFSVCRFQHFVEKNASTMPDPVKQVPMILNSFSSSNNRLAGTKTFFVFTDSPQIRSRVCWQIFLSIVECTDKALICP